MKIIFFGSSSYCLPVLKSLNNNFSLSCIVTKPGGFVSDFAAKNHVTSFTHNNEQELLSLKEQLHYLKPDLAIVADFGMIIPPDIFNIPKHKTLNIHFSRLPDLRGASPVQFTILRGDKSAWISIIIMDEGLDTGDIVWQKEFLHNKLDILNTKEVYRKLFEIAGDYLPDVIKKYTAGELKPHPQDHSQATYSKTLTREVGYTQFEKINTEDVARKLRAFTPWPGIWTKVKIKGVEKRLRILSAHSENEKTVLDVVQLEGKKPVSWKQFLEGYPELKQVEA